MNARSQVPVYRMRKTTGIAWMHDLTHFAFWLSRHLPHEVQVEGVTCVRDNGNGATMNAPLITPENGLAGNYQQIIPKPPAFRFQRRKGIAFREDALAYFDFLAAELMQPMLSSDNITAASRNQRFITFGPPVDKPDV